MVFIVFSKKRVSQQQNRMPSQTARKRRAISDWKKLYRATLHLFIPLELWRKIILCQPWPAVDNVIPYGKGSPASVCSWSSLSMHLSNTCFKASQTFPMQDTDHTRLIFYLCLVLAKCILSKWIPPSFHNSPNQQKHCFAVHFPYKHSSQPTAHDQRREQSSLEVKFRSRSLILC